VAASSGPRTRSPRATASNVSAGIGERISFGALDYSLGSRHLAADCELPWLARADARAEADLTLCLRTRSTPRAQFAPWYESESVTIDRADDGSLLARFADDAAFLVTARSIALVDAPPHYTIDDLAAYALGPLLALALHLRQAVLIHASAVEIGGRAILFAGQSGSGKSTLAAMLHRQGRRVLSDDTTEIAAGVARASIPALRIRQPAGDKKILPVQPADDRPIGAILFLEDRGVESLERLTPREGWQRLLANAYTAHLPDPAMAQRIFEETAALADRVPMFRYTAALR
jgi:hypothetical protein